LYCGLLLVARLLTGLYFLHRAPALLRRRLKWREKERPQWVSRSITGALVLLGRVIAGLDHRYGWSQMPLPLVLAAGVGLLGVFALQFQVFRENEFAATTVEVEEEQRVISSGPYAIVRHPMYLSALLLFAFSPLTLGSSWAVLAFLPAPISLVLRLRNEEAVLTRDLPGYEEYCQRVRWRLLPGLW
jgi:protein-S-isoprenylcysteine O-methyltransferase Ste14